MCSLQHNYEANSAVDQDVSTDTDDENIVQYHVVRDNAESWIVEDFDRVSCLVFITVFTDYVLIVFDEK